MDVVALGHVGAPRRLDEAAYLGFADAGGEQIQLRLAGENFAERGHGRIVITLAIYVMPEDVARAARVEAWIDSPGIAGVRSGVDEGLRNGIDSSVIRMIRAR